MSVHCRACQLLCARHQLFLCYGKMRMREDTLPCPFGKWDWDNSLGDSVGHWSCPRFVTSGVADDVSNLVAFSESVQHSVASD